MSAKQFVFSSETKLTKQQIADLIVLTELTLSNAEKVTLDSDGAIKIYLCKGLIRIPKESSIYKDIKRWYGKPLRKEKKKEEKEEGPK